MPDKKSFYTIAGFALLVFCTGTAEYLVAGILPQLAKDLSVSVAATGKQ
ncbi:MAG: hypothetical protein Q4A92_08785 [Corynebacterium sp.]|nr:hypothetical protein [Corynebacterium sp.]